MGNAIVTGGSGGIGLEMARALAAAGHQVIVTGRGRDKLERATADIANSTGQNQIEAVPLDLGDFDAVRAFAADMGERFAHIDILILNAGLYTWRMHRLPNGFEAMIGVMHLGHFLLANLLLERVLAAPAPRVVVTSSVGHKGGKIDFDSFTDPSRHRLGFAGYAQAKLANLLFARELVRRYGEQGLTANAFHPGAIATGIWRELPPPLPWLANKFMTSTAQGADTGVWLATAEEAGGFNGEYFVNRKVASSSSTSKDTNLARRLWEESERLTGLKRATRAN